MLYVLGTKTITIWIQFCQFNLIQEFYVTVQMYLSYHLLFDELQSLSSKLNV